ncbi:MAG: LysR family transcriptional regulator [Candidatus Bathyarchaeota archaeon]|nr:MAG: LysR family transcriptional regulator [Candidatus Bathyarchaeota archaeon]
MAEKRTIIKRPMLKPKYKLWLETENGYVIGKGSFTLLQEIKEKGTLSEAAKTLNMSYRHAWGIIKNIEKRIGTPVVKTHRGGKYPGGGTKLTQTGLELVKTYLMFEKTFNRICTNQNKK